MLYHALLPMQWQCLGVQPIFNWFTCLLLTWSHSQNRHDIIDHGFVLGEYSPNPNCTFVSILPYNEYADLSHPFSKRDKVNLGTMPFAIFSYVQVKLTILCTIFKVGISALLKCVSKPFSAQWTWVCAKETFRHTNASTKCYLFPTANARPYRKHWVWYTPSLTMLLIHFLCLHTALLQPVYFLLLTTFWRKKLQNQPLN